MKDDLATHTNTLYQHSVMNYTGIHNRPDVNMCAVNRPDQITHGTVRLAKIVSQEQEVTEPFKLTLTHVCVLTSAHSTVSSSLTRLFETVFGVQIC